MNDSVSVTYSPSSETTTTNIGEFCRMEQVYKESVRDAADNNDISQMIATARSGKSAYNYIYDVCPYVTVIGTVLEVKLDFFVWPSDMDLKYTMITGVGTIGNKKIIKEHRAFDVPFQSSSTASFNYLFSGQVSKEMPVFSVRGESLSEIPIEKHDTYLSYPVAITSVFRASGTVEGHRYTLTMELDKAPDGPTTTLIPSYSTILQYDTGGGFDFSKIVHRAGAVGAAYKLTFINTEIFNVYKNDTEFVSAGNRTKDYSNKYFSIPTSAWFLNWDKDDYVGFTVEETINEVDVSGYKIENLEADIVLTWIDRDGNPQETLLDIKIPPCVEDLLTDCSGDGSDIPAIFSLNAGGDGDDDDEDKDVYYNACNGELL